MLITASIGNIVGCTVCIILSLVTFNSFRMALKVVKSKENPDDILGRGVIVISLTLSIASALVPVGFLLMAYLERNRHIIDFLILNN